MENEKPYTRKKNTKYFFWNNYTPKVKHETLCNDYKARGFKNIDVRNKTRETVNVSTIAFIHYSL